MLLYENFALSAEEVRLMRCGTGLTLRSAARELRRSTFASNG
jgi:hypothetical protein